MEVSQRTVGNTEGTHIQTAEAVHTVEVGAQEVTATTAVAGVIAEAVTQRAKATVETEETGKLLH